MKTFIFYLLNGDDDPTFVAAVEEEDLLEEDAHLKSMVDGDVVTRDNERVECVVSL